MSKFTRKRDNFLNKAKDIINDAKDYVNNDLENDFQNIAAKEEKTLKKAAEQVERYVDKHLVDDLHSAGAVISKAADQTVEASRTAAEQVKDFAHCVENCACDSTPSGQDSGLNNEQDL